MLESLQTQFYIKDLTLSDPLSSQIERKIEVSDKDAELTAKFLQYSAPHNMRLQQSYYRTAAQSLVLFPDKTFKIHNPSNSLIEKIKTDLVNSEFQWIEKFTRSISLIGSILAVKPEIEVEDLISKELQPLIKYKLLNFHRILPENRFIFPELVNPKLYELIDSLVTDWKKELDLPDGPKLYATYLSSARIFFPEHIKYFSPSNKVWSLLIKRLIELRNQVQEDISILPDPNPRFRNYLKYAYDLKIISAKDIRINNRNLELTFPKEQFNHPTKATPIRRKF